MRPQKPLQTAVFLCGRKKNGGEWGVFLCVRKNRYRVRFVGSKFVFAGCKIVPRTLEGHGGWALVSGWCSGTEWRKIVSRRVETGAWEVLSGVGFSTPCGGWKIVPGIVLGA